jgi:small subunit ribosomal protein S18
VSERGKIRSRRITGLSRRQQSLVSAAVKRARTMGLLPYPDQDRKVR